MSALIVDIILWGSVAVLGFMAWQRGRTVLVIAHRLATVRNADRIVVVHEGRLAEVGRHDELIARDGVYRRLYALQMEGVAG